MMFDAKNFKQYRTEIGFKNQNDLKLFLSAKDIKSEIDFTYIENLNERLYKIVKTLNNIVHDSIRIKDLDAFCEKNILDAYTTLRNNKILQKLNNQGRRREQVYFSWMRGAIISQFFKKALSQIFGVEESEIRIIGNDNLDNIENFKRQPIADLQIERNGQIFQIEMQSGHQGINDIKESKVKQARRQYVEHKIKSLVIHFDLFNGQVAFVNISNISENNINWETRAQMEGQTVFKISQDYFVWSLTDPPPKLEDILHDEN